MKRTRCSLIAYTIHAIEAISDYYHRIDNIKAYLNREIRIL